MKHTRTELEEAYEEMERRVQERTAQLARINEALMEEIAERKKVEKDVLEISEKEQRRLGVLIHDELCQNLTGIMILAKVLAQKMERRGLSESLAESLELKKVVGLLDQSITQAREMARGFYPVELKTDSLMIALKDLAGRTASVYGISCRFSCPQPILIDDNNVATHLYRIVQEAVHNAVKHGRAKHVQISLIDHSRDGAGLLLIVQDDGIGMPADPEGQVGIGLHIMKYRARMIDATLQIREGDARGTVLTCAFSHTKGRERRCGHE